MAFVQQMLADAWTNFGTELLIFALTFLATMILRTAPEQVRKGMKNVGKATDAEAANHRKVASTNVAGGHTLAHEGMAAQQPFRQLLREISEASNAQSPAQALALYSDLRSNLLNSGMSLTQAAGVSVPIALDMYATLVRCVLRTNQDRLMEKLFDDMARFGIRRPLTFYESTMKQLAGQKQFHLALRMYDRLVEDGHEPNIIMYSCLINFAELAGDPDRAVAFFQRLCEITTPSIRACMCVLRVYGKRRDWKKSLALIRDMQNWGISLDSLVLNVVLATGVAANQIEAAGSLLDELSAANKSLADTVSYNTITKGHAMRGDIDAARATLGRMRGQGLRPNAISFNTVMDGAVRAGRPHEAWEILTEMRNAHLRPDKYSCSILAKCLGKGSEKMGAQRIHDTLSLLEEVGPGSEGMLHSKLYSSVLEAAIAHGDDTLVSHVRSVMMKHKAMPTKAMQHRLRGFVARGGDDAAVNSEGQRRNKSN